MEIHTLYYIAFMTIVVGGGSLYIGKLMWADARRK